MCGHVQGPSNPRGTWPPLPAAFLVSMASLCRSSLPMALLYVPSRSICYSHLTAYCFICACTVCLARQARLACPL